MKYGLFMSGKLIRLCSSLKDVISSRAYEPWNARVEIYEFVYNASGHPITASLVK